MTDQNLILALIRPVGFDNPDELVEASAKIGIAMGERAHHIKPRAGDNLLINLLTHKSFSTSKPLSELKEEFEKLGRVAYLYEKETEFYYDKRISTIGLKICHKCKGEIKPSQIYDNRDDYKYCSDCAIKLLPRMLGVFASEEEVRKVLEG